jgi:hypothetical protein
MAQFYELDNRTFESWSKTSFKYLSGRRALTLKFVCEFRIWKDLTNDLGELVTNRCWVIVFGNRLAKY